MTRNGLTEEQAMTRIRSQMPLSEKEKRADRTSPRTARWKNCVP